MIEAIGDEFGSGPGIEFGRHNDHEYIEGLFYSQMESLTRGLRR